MKRGSVATRTALDVEEPRVAMPCSRARTADAVAARAGDRSSSESVSVSEADPGPITPVVSDAWGVPACCDDAAPPCCTPQGRVAAAGGCTAAANDDATTTLNTTGPATAAAVASEVLPCASPGVGSPRVALSCWAATGESGATAPAPATATLPAADAAEAHPWWSVTKAGTEGTAGVPSSESRARNEKRRVVAPAGGGGAAAADAAMAPGGDAYQGTGDQGSVAPCCAVIASCAWEPPCACGRWARKWRRQCVPAPPTVVTD